MLDRPVTPIRASVIFPPLPAFYAKPKSIDEMVAHSVARVLDLFGIHSAKLARWRGLDDRASSS